MSEKSPIPIIFEDENYLVINKPADLLVHRSPISRDKVSVIQILKEQLNVDYIHPVHRLDRATSGVLLMSKNTETTQFATEQFMSKQTIKTYFTIIRGWPKEQEGIVRKALKNHKGVVQEAETEYKLIHRVELPVQISKFSTARYSLVRCRPVTGRQHQIRRHVKHLTGPVIGDTKFGKKEHNDYFKNVHDCPQLLLFSAQLKLNIYSGKQVVLKANLPSYFEHLCDEFSWSKDMIIANY